MPVPPLKRSGRIPGTGTTKDDRKSTRGFPSDHAEAPQHEDDSEHEADEA